MEQQRASEDTRRLNGFKVSEVRQWARGNFPPSGVGFKANRFQEVAVASLITAGNFPFVMYDPSYVEEVETPMPKAVRIPPEVAVNGMLDTDTNVIDANANFVVPTPMAPANIDMHAEVGGSYGLFSWVELLLAFTQNVTLGDVILTFTWTLPTPGVPLLIAGPLTAQPNINVTTGQYRIKWRRDFKAGEGLNEGTQRQTAVYFAVWRNLRGTPTPSRAFVSEVGAATPVPLRIGLVGAPSGMTIQARALSPQTDFVLSVVESVSRLTRRR
jgi:hypothetical protein